MTGRTSKPESAGGPAHHIPVLANEALNALQPLSGQTIVDGTFGAGGYSRMLLEGGANVIGIDRDPNVLRDADALGQAYPSQFRFLAGEFGSLDRLLTENDCAPVDGIVLDIGVSSMQLDQADRGFSFRNDGPLDMRMAGEGLTAAQVVNEAEQSDLTRIFGILGEERKASRAARAVVARRENQPFLRTKELADVVAGALGQRFSDKIHPATRVFQGLRIFVNRELDQLVGALFAAERILAVGGRLVVVTFHSLEDRIVKQFFKSRSGVTEGSRHAPQIAEVSATFEQAQRNAVKPSKSELDVNPRARSAKMRWGVRTSTAAMAEDLGIFGREVGFTLSGRLSDAASA